MEQEKSNVIGIAAGNISPAEEGFITIIGTVENINTFNPGGFEFSRW